MPFTPECFASKLIELRTSFDSTHEVVSDATGIGIQRIKILEAGRSEPTGDEVLILSDYFGCEFTWLVDDDEISQENNLQLLFRMEGERLDTADRHAIKEFIQLCKNQTFLDQVLIKPRPSMKYEFTPIGSYFIGQGQTCSNELRTAYNLLPHAVIPDIYQWLRDIGIQVFRRVLPTSTISGLFVDHPYAGRCILINITEDLYRQRFSAAHEAGHAIMDRDRSYNLSDNSDLSSIDGRELRANAFASHFLMPPQLLRNMGSNIQWSDPAKIVDAADKLWVSVPALLSALVGARILDNETRATLRAMNLRPPVKREAELIGQLAPMEYRRKQALIERGLHAAYVTQCFDAYAYDLITQGKLAEMLFVTIVDLPEVAALFGTSLRHG